MADKTGKTEKTIALNRQARHEYYVLESLEAGLALAGTEVKSLRAGNVNLKGAWVDLSTGEAWVQGMHISPYEKGNIFNKDPFRPRKLLLHRRELSRLAMSLKTQGLTLIPLRLYFNGPRVKVELGLCKGKKLYDKRDSEAERDARREIERAGKQSVRDGMRRG